MTLHLPSNRTARVAVVQPPQDADADTSGDEKEEEEADVDDSEILEDWPDETEVSPLLSFLAPFCMLILSRSQRK